MSSASLSATVPGNVGNAPPLTLTFNIEKLRMLAYVNLLIMVAVGVVVTEKYVTVEPEKTVIFTIFGFNHICNVFDHQPSRLISALLVLFFIVPMSAFVVLSYFRTARAARIGNVPPHLQAYNKVITPFVFLSVCYTYMWFVNAPDGTYGFLGHYLPYVALQLALGLLAIQEVGYLIHHQALPFGASVRLAKLYLVVLLTTTVVCQAAVFSLLLGYPILDSPNSASARTTFQVLMYFYSFLAIVMPLFFAARNRHNGQDNTITFS